MVSLVTSVPHQGHWRYEGISMVHCQGTMFVTELVKVLAFIVGCKAARCTGRLGPAGCTTGCRGARAVCRCGRMQVHPVVRVLCTCTLRRAPQGPRVQGATREALWSMSVGSQMVQAGGALLCTAPALRVGDDRYPAGPWTRVRGVWNLRALNMPQGQGPAGPAPVVQGRPWACRAPDGRSGRRRGGLQTCGAAGPANLWRGTACGPAAGRSCSPADHRLQHHLGCPWWWGACGLSKHTTRRHARKVHPLEVDGDSSTKYSMSEGHILGLWVLCQKCKGVRENIRI